LAKTTRKRKPSLPRQKSRAKQTAAAKARAAEKSAQKFELISILISFLGLFLLLSLLSYVNHPYGTENLMGRVGKLVSSELFEWLGWCSFAAVAWAFAVSAVVWKAGGSTKSKSGAEGDEVLVNLIASVVMVLAISSIVTIFFGSFSGGRIGEKIVAEIVPHFNSTGALLISFAVFLLALGVISRTKLEQIMSVSSTVARWFGTGLADMLYFVHGSARFLLGVVLGSFAWFINGFNESWSRERDDKEPAPESEDLRRASFFGKKKVSESVDTEPEEMASQPVISGRTRFSSYTLGDDSLGDPELSSSSAQADIDLRLPERDNTSLEIEVASSEQGEDYLEESIKISRREVEEKAEAENEKLSPKKGFFGRFSKKAEDEESDLEAFEEDEPEFDPPDYEDYELPGTDMLVAGEGSASLGPKDKELLANSRLLERALKDFRIGGKVVEVHPGPVVTLYQFNPAAGVKVQRIINLADDLALALKVARVRVYAPVPGKGTVGIEVPNSQRQIVRLRDILDTDPCWNPDVPLELALGKDTFGDCVVADLAKMPHLLIAGATGTGKSVCINSVLMSLLYRNSPEDLRLMLIDPKMLELTVYERIPHLKAPVVTNPKDAKGLLWWAVEEMERRYRLMMKLGVRSLENYNRAVHDKKVSSRKSRGEQVIELEEHNVVATADSEGGVDRAETAESADAIARKRVVEEGEKLPRIVIVVDELADLMLTAGRDIEELLTRLAQKARAAGIHLILATQRPSVNVITGLIKANFPSRISFQVASKIDSRTIIDTSGAEKLLGQGDMLFMPPGTGRLRRLHSPFVSDAEVRTVTDYIRTQGEPDYDPAVTEMIEKLKQKDDVSEAMGGDGIDFDPLYDQAVQLVVEKGKASTSMVQRAFKIGYNRAARILDSMESEGVVGPADGARPRQVIIPGRAEL